MVLKPTTMGVAAAMSARRTYIDKVMGYLPIAYWPLDETTGSTAVCRVNAAQNGSYTGVTLGQTQTDSNGVSFVCPLFDADGDYANPYTATLAGVFSGVAGTSMLWMKAFNAGVWTDSTQRFLSTFGADNNNRVIMFRTTTNNQLQFRYVAGGTTETVDDTSLGGSTDWNHLAITWDKNAGATGEVKVFINGSQSGATQDGLGVWAGAIADATTWIGSRTGGGDLWHGWLAHVALWDSALSAAQIADLAAV